MVSDMNCSLLRITGSQVQVLLEIRFGLNLQGASMHRAFHNCPDLMVDSSTVICWMSPFVILDVSGLFCCFSSIFDEKS